MPARARSRTTRALFFFFKCSMVAIALALPLLGAWTASSLAAYANGPRNLAILVGLLGFPILPLAWDAIAKARQNKADRARRQILTFGDRLWLRTFALNAIFVVTLFATKPQSAVRALQARGDWMLDHRSAPWANQARTVLHGAADALEWIYRSDHDNPYEHDDGGKKIDEGSHDRKPAPVRRGDSEVVTPDSKNADAGVAQVAEDADAGSDLVLVPNANDAWPSARTPLPFAVDVPTNDEASPTTVANYLKQNASDELTRARAVHDYVASHIAYDVVSFSNPSKRSPQDADAVFARKTGVCEGYARLFETIAKSAGLESELVTGDAKGAGNEVDGRGHAWNAVKANGQWYLVDSTWDAGFVDDNAFTKKYTSEYLFAPPAVFGVDHFPTLAKWQLRTPTITRGDFMRAPQMRPIFFANGSTLQSPDRSQITVNGVAEADVLLPKNRPMYLAAVSEKDDARNRCEVTRGATSHVKCVLPVSGTYRILFFESPKEYGTYEFVGELVALAQ